VNSRRAWIVFAAGTFAYIVGVMQRSSLGVAGVSATERFDIQAAALSTLAVVQIIVYTALQIPVGVILDRIGPKPLIVAGAAVMALGQLLMAIAPGFGLAVAARILVGLGDAFTFISMQRVVAAWFSGRRAPLVSQLLATTGTLGQVLSAVPFALLLHAAGWTPTFLSAASVSVLACIVAVVLLSSQPSESTRAIPLPTGKALHQLREALARPGTQLGFWSHFVTQSSGTVFTLLWGVPFLSVGLGYGQADASALLTVIVGTALVSGPILGVLTARYPHRRSNIVLGIVAALGIAWAIVLAWPGVPPLWIIIALLIVIGVGGPGSVIGFDFARTFNPARSLGSANGIVNVGGFLASFVMMLLIGIVLDVLDSLHGGAGNPTTLYRLDSFRIAFLVQYLIVGIGVGFLVRARRRTRRRLHDDEGITVAPLWVALSRAWRRRGSRA
jgi:MFS family permease